MDGETFLNAILAFLSQKVVVFIGGGLSLSYLLFTIYQSYHQTRTRKEDRAS